MIYIVNPWYEESSGSWVRDYIDGVHCGLSHLGIPHKELSNKYSNELLKQLLALPEKSVVWFTAYENPFAPVLRKRRPDLALIAHAHGTKTMWMEPSYVHSGQVFEGTSEEVESKCEEPYDILFCNSHYQKRYMTSQDKAVVTGFPLDLEAYKFRFANIVKVNRAPKSIVITQRFSMEKNLPIALWFCRLLIEKGYDVTWCYGAKTGDFELLSDFVEQAKQMGVKIQYNSSKMEYYETLMRSEYVLTTSLYDTLSLSMIEGALAGCKVVAPRIMCFPEYMVPSNMYDPFSAESLFKTIDTAKEGVQGFSVTGRTYYNSNYVVSSMLEAMASERMI